jgi:hypothetical protein
VARLLIGADVDGELATIAEPWRSIVAHLAAQPAHIRPVVWQDWLAGRADRDAIITALAGVEPSGPAPEPEITERCATLADIRQLVGDTRWLWPGWLAAAVLNALAADPGTGKTLMAFHLALTLWFKRSWPDGSENPCPQGTKTLWVPGDRHYPQLLDLAEQHGLPEDALLLNAPQSDPTAGLDLDDKEELTALTRRIEAEKPGLVIVDTVGMTTAANLCKPEDARGYFGPLMRIAQETGVPFLLLTHLSKDANALGRRIVEKARVVWKMTTPDPEAQPDRRRVWVDKTYIPKPPAMGMTIADAGCSFDFTPPSEPEPITRKPGPPPEKLEKCKRWLAERLTPNPARVTDIRTDADKADFSAKLLYAARDALDVTEYTFERRKWWKLPEGAVVPDVPVSPDDNSHIPHIDTEQGETDVRVPDPL